MHGLGRAGVALNALHLFSTKMRCTAAQRPIFTYLPLGAIILENVNVLNYTPLWWAVEDLIILMKNHNMFMSKQSASYLVRNPCFVVDGMFLGSSISGNN
jgi:hypothetical protein